MAVKNILDKIENLVVTSKRVPLSNKCLIDDNDLVHLVDDLRKELPMELQKAEGIMHDRQQIIDDAHQDADRIIDKAKQYAEKLTDEDEVVVQAKEKARLIMEQTAAQQKELIERTDAEASQRRQDAINYANQLHDGALTYANQVFDTMLSSLQNAMSVIQQAKNQVNTPVNENQIARGENEK
ncbi:MAG: hypothetical protein PUI81_07860 [Veillonellaceae bacterium]|nr:hypothetical protein [Veillonellaceae bacterium]MDD6924002.1 hypothetical protein [Veillonellaceae bacterium]